jgi:hypothetical protein
MLRQSSFPTLRRLLHLIVVIFITFDIASDVLDLDLSDFPLEEDPHERVLVATQVAETSELVRSLDHDGIRTKRTILGVSTFKMQTNGLGRTLRFRTVPTQIYRRLIFPHSNPGSLLPEAFSYSHARLPQSSGLNSTQGVSSVEFA